MTKIFEGILKARGFSESFLRPKYEELFDPFLLSGVLEAVGRIEKALLAGEKVVIYGDYDADGVTASTVMVEGLEYFGSRPEQITVMLPDRFKDGYGMNLPVVPRIVETGARLVITVDCGSGSEEAIAELFRQGIETIVTDHHEIPEVPKSAVAVVNPKLGKVGVNMAGVGVAFTVARALNMRKNGKVAEREFDGEGGELRKVGEMVVGKCDGQEKWLLDMVAIGTVCDSMVLFEENRTMVFYGMKVMAKTRRVGLLELARRAGVDLEKMTTQAIGFQLGPRINAAGRLASAEIALKLMRTKSRAEAVALAGELEELNKRRRVEQEAAVDEVATRGVGKEKVIVVSGKWHEGIVGIVAGKLTEQYKRPAFALTELEDGRSKGSGRSFGEFSLASLIEAMREEEEGLLLTGGGHAGACGVSLLQENLERFREFANEYYRGLGLRNQERFLRVKSDVVLRDFAEVGLELFEELRLLEPFGEGNLEPVFEFTGEVTDVKLLKEKHLNLVFRDKSGRFLKMMGFFAPKEWVEAAMGESAGSENLGSEFSDSDLGDYGEGDLGFSDSSIGVKRLKVQFSLMENEWRGLRKVEGRIVGVERVGA